MKTLLLVLSLVISWARSHYNYNQFHIDNRNSEPEASSYYNSQQVRKPMYHHYPMTFFSQQQFVHSYQTTSKPYYATTSSLAVRNNSPIDPSPYWYHPSTYVRPGVVFEYQFHGPSPPQPTIQDRYSEVILPLTLLAELAEPVEEVENVDQGKEAVDSHLIEASVTIGSDDTTVEVSTEVDISTDLLDDEQLTPQSTTPAEEDSVTTSFLEEVDDEVKVEVTTIPDDITTQSDILTTESPVTFERHQSIIPFYLRPSSWRARSFGPHPRYYHPNHYYGPEEARDLPSIFV